VADAKRRRKRAERAPLQRSRGDSLHSVENHLLYLDSVCGRNLVYGCDGELVSELAKCSSENVRPFLFGLRINFGASLDKSHTLMQDLPNQTAETMGDGPRSLTYSPAAAVDVGTPPESNCLSS
jgi:hypothetical protein